VVLVTHADGGGVQRFVDARAAIHRGAGLRPILLQPSPRSERAADAPGDCIVDGAPGLRFRLPAELPALARLLAAERPVHLELHHLLGHHPALLSLADRLGIPWDAYVHDYAAVCPRVTLVGAAGRYCGEPDLAGCTACIAACGSLLEEPVTVAGLRRRSADWLERVRAVIAPSEDTARRLRRHLPRLRLRVTPWEDARPAAPVRRPGRAPARICVAGAIGVEKGFAVLLACARDAAARRLPLEFVVVGHTIDDTALFATGRVFVTGPYRPEEAVALLAAQQAELGFLPSVWPESWSYVLTELWQAGLAVAAFDIGAPAERIRQAGGGHLLPLAASPAAINDTLLRLSTAGCATVNAVPLHTAVQI
jgi:glycosyltransferase involved in cell wall biosynthesis